MELVTLEYTHKYGDKKEGVVLYFKDKQSAEEYKFNQLEGDPNITLEDDCIGYQYYTDNDFWEEINNLVIDRTWARLNPNVPERVVERMVEPTFYEVKYTDISDKIKRKLLRSQDEMKEYMAKVIDAAVGPATVIKMSLDQLVEKYENA